VDKDQRVPVRIGHQEDDTYFCWWRWDK
jgi:hypothetical protein